MLESPLHGCTLDPAGSLSGFPAGFTLCHHPMISTQSHWSPLENAGLTSDKQNQQEPKEGVGLLSRVTEVKFSNFQKAD